MSHNITIEGGTSVRLPTAGKYCDRDIVVTATGGGITPDEVATATITGDIVLSATSIADYAFYKNTKLKSLSAPNVKSIGTYAFNGSGVSNVFLPSVTTIGTRCFNSCKGLTRADLGSVSRIDSYGFYACSNLKIVILRKEDAIATLGSANVFQSGPIYYKSDNGYLYVPSALIEQYKVATNWSTYSKKFRAIEDYPDICGV